MHLANLKRQGKIRAWQDRDIEAGAEWDAAIKQQLETAEIILLLITARFINSDYCYDLEMQRALQRHAAGTARVIPIILKPCDWKESPFSHLQALPKDAKPVTKWDDPDEAFLNVVQGLRKAVESLQAKVSSTPSPAHPLTPSPTPQFSTYNPATFTGREAETAELTAQLQGNCRVVAIVGMTGIGKTALGERVIANLLETAEAPLPYYRLSLDDRSLTPDFASSGAALLRTLGEEPNLEDQKDPANLLTHILQRLGSHPCRVQIDSLERLLRGNDQEGWSEFCDPLWLDFLQQVLAQTACPSQLLLTSQDIPGELDTMASRYPQFWYCQPLQGLDGEEQQDLFQKLGLLSHPGATDPDYLSPIGTFYAGHPLVLQVIADEIRQPPFRGNIAHYWQHYEAEFTATTTTPNKLARSRLFRRRVRQRVEQTLHGLPAPARQMLCASAVFRRPVPVEFWQAMLPEGDADAAFDTLQDRHLVEYATIPSVGEQSLLASEQSLLAGERSRTTPPLLIRQHNLIRSVAYDLLKADTVAWEVAERQAAHLWLNDYEPAPDAPNLETVRGYLEAFDHYCEVGDWDAAVPIAWTRLDRFIQDPLSLQLGNWGYFREQVIFCDKLLDISRITGNRKAESFFLSGLGNAYKNLGRYERSVEYHQQDFSIALEICDREGQGVALGNLGIVYNRLSKYEYAIDVLQQRLEIAREIGDRDGEGRGLGNLGIAYKNLGQYDQSIKYHQQSLQIARETRNYLGECAALGNLGIAYDNLGDYERAIDYHLQDLKIAQSIRDRRGEGSALGNLGLSYNGLNQHEQAISYHQKYLEIAREIGDLYGEGIALVNMGATQLKLKQHLESSANNQAALEIFQEIGERACEAEALNNLAELHQALDEVETARQYGQQALALATELGIPLKAECEALMQELGTGGEGKQE
jgi:tetratricopeptide (TPR) repeat protein